MRTRAITTSAAVRSPSRRWAAASAALALAAALASRTRAATNVGSAALNASIVRTGGFRATSATRAQGAGVPSAGAPCGRPLHLLLGFLGLFLKLLPTRLDVLAHALDGVAGTQ